MNLETRIDAFVKLGEFLKEFLKSHDKNFKLQSGDNEFVKGFSQQVKLASQYNSWFTLENIFFSLNSWAQQLDKEQIYQWVNDYDLRDNPSKNVAIIMAGNIPLVGFHDFLSVLISGHNVLVKQSSNDRHILPYLAQYLIHIEPGFKNKIEFTEEKLTDFYAVIATGSNNTSRYFEYYFKSKPSIIRKNRNSVAVLTGTESEVDLALLSEDIFRYYGLGCRSVSKLYVPKGYNFDAFFNAIYRWKDLVNEQKYANNYDYNKAVYLMSEFKILDNGFFMAKEDESLASPIATIFYEYYTDLEKLKSDLKEQSSEIQCIVSSGVFEDEIMFGQTQKPRLKDYADNVDTIEFLSRV